MTTGVVVVVFVQIHPEAKKRQYQQALNAYEAAVGDQARAGSGQALLKDQGKEGKAERWFRRAADAGGRGRDGQPGDPAQ
jgi:hypothetical protein